MSTIADLIGLSLTRRNPISQQPLLTARASRFDSWLPRLSLLLFFLLCAGYFAVPLWDSDFWWHIASGREILQHGIPDSDPFGVFPATDVVRNDTVLKGQWLGQVVLFSVFDAGGVNAVVALRVAVLLACMGLVVWRSRWLGVGWLALWPVLILLALTVEGFGGERPQLLSFLFAALFFALLDRAEKDRRWLIALPPVALLWANSHGGVLLGVALLGLWTGLKLLERGLSWNQRRAWLLATSGVVLASLMTPNGLQTYLYLLDLEGSELQARTSEYISAFQLYTLGYVWPQVWVAMFYILAFIAAMAKARERQWRPLAVMVFLGAISASSFRYFAFFLFLAGPYVAAGLEDGLKKWTIYPAHVGRITQGLLLLVLVTALVLGLWRETLFRGGFYQQRYPVEIADFVQQNRYQGRAFNTLEWGGYLLWRLAPTIRPYIDGRMLDEERFPPYTNILWATPPGIAWFEHENFNLVIMPYHGQFDRQRYSLLDYLRTQPQWQQVYRDAKGVVFVRNDNGGRRGE